MKVFTIAIFLLLTATFPAMAVEVHNKIFAANEYNGYMVYETLDSNGDKMVIKTPVSYKIQDSAIPQDNDQNYQYRSYHIEVDRERNETITQEKADIETKKINSAMYYPLYFD